MLTIAVFLFPRLGLRLIDIVRRRNLRLSTLSEDIGIALFGMFVIEMFLHVPRDVRLIITERTFVIEDHRFGRNLIDLSFVTIEKIQIRTADRRRFRIDTVRFARQIT